MREPTARMWKIACAACFAGGILAALVGIGEIAIDQISTGISDVLIGIGAIWLSQKVGHKWSSWV